MFQVFETNSKEQASFMQEKAKNQQFKAGSLLFQELTPVMGQNRFFDFFEHHESRVHILYSNPYLSILSLRKKEPPNTQIFIFVGLSYQCKKDIVFRFIIGYTLVPSPIRHWLYYFRKMLKFFRNCSFRIKKYCEGK